MICLHHYAIPRNEQVLVKLIMYFKTCAYVYAHVYIIK